MTETSQLMDFTEFFNNVLLTNDDIVKRRDVSDDSDIIEASPPSSRKKPLKKKRRKIIESADLHLQLNRVDKNDLKRFEKDKIENTKIGAFDFCCPFLYHSVEEVLKYTEDCLPRNNNLHLIGTYRVSDCNGYYIEEYGNRTVKINLDFAVATCLPQEDDTISVYGSVEFKEVCSRKLIVLVVRFFRPEIEHTVTKYIENLKVLRNLIPTTYFSTIPYNKKLF